MTTEKIVLLLNGFLTIVSVLTVSKQNGQAIGLLNQVRVQVLKFKVRFI